MIEDLGGGLLVGSSDKGLNIFSVYDDPKLKPTILTPEETIGANIQDWGSGNTRPTDWRKKLEKTTTAFPLIVQSAETYFGKGLQYFREIKTAKGIERDYSLIPDVESFMEANDLDYVMLERWMDLQLYNNLFCEFLVNKKGDKIAKIVHMEAEFCRFGEIKENEILNVQVSSDWSKGLTPVSVDFLDDYAIGNKDAVWRKIGKKKKFITHNNVPSPGRTLYAAPRHIGLFEPNGFLDFAISVPKLMNAINKNGFLLRYHIEIPYDYWTQVYKDWQMKKPEEQQKLRDDKIEEMNLFLSNSENAGKNFYSHFGIHQATGKEIPGWKITSLTDPIKKDQFLTSLQEADIQTARAIGFDASLSNISVGNNTMGAGSGSNKRVGMDNAIASSYAKQMVVLRPLWLVGRANGWPANLKWTFEHEIPTSLNENKDGVKIV
jgi:hypothetical protein